MSNCTSNNVVFCRKRRFYYHSRRIIAIHAKHAKWVLQKIPKYTIINTGKFVQRKIIVYYHLLVNVYLVKLDAENSNWIINEMSVFSGNVDWKLESNPS